jgi:TolA-binding protein
MTSNGFRAAPASGKWRMALAILLAGFLGCGGSAKDLLDTAQLEETQHNVPHARELYQEVLRRYPNSAEAATAAARLQALGERRPDDAAP